MLTPRFKLTQTESTVTINIRAPYCQLRDLDVDHTKNEFYFHCTPYYLRLNLPGCITEKDPTTSFDVDSGEFTFTYEKVTQGEYFENLDLITKLLAKKLDVTEPDKPKIQVLSSDTPAPISNDDNLDVEEFGFAMQHKNDFVFVSSEFNDVFEVDPRSTKLPERHRLRLEKEQQDFSHEHYIADYFDDDEIKQLMALTCPWSEELEVSNFTDAELDFLKDLTNKEYLLSEQQIKICLHSLVDILFAYCYDQRTTYFETTCESGWTIVKMAPTFCWLDTFSSCQEVIVSSFRRGLIYPLYRHFELLQVILDDLKCLLKMGERIIIKALHQMYNIFLGGDCCRYILNRLFIKDYIVYIMSWDKEKWSEIVTQVNEICIEKEDLGLALNEFENSTGDDFEKESVKDVVSRLGKLVIKPDDSDDCESDYEGDVDNYSTSSSSSEDYPTSSISSGCESDNVE